jgi:hypothetical protein
MAGQTEVGPTLDHPALRMVLTIVTKGPPQFKQIPSAKVPQGRQGAPAIVARQRVQAQSPPKNPEKQALRH